MHSNNSVEQQSGHLCPECSERTQLRDLVGELLFKNQALRFDLHSALEQLKKGESPFDGN